MSKTFNGEIFVEDYKTDDEDNQEMVGIWKNILKVKR